MSFSVKILGNSSAVPAHGRNLSAQYVLIHNQGILIDCGEGTQKRLLSENIPFNKIRHILISHLHGDHFYGLPGLLATMSLFHRPLPLHIYAHAPLRELLDSIQQTSQTHLSFEIIFHNLGDLEEVLIDHKKFSVTSFPLKHRLPCCGFKIMEKSKPHRIVKEKLHQDISLADIGFFLKGEDAVDEMGNLRYAAAEYTLPPKRSRSYAYCSDTAFDPDICQYIGSADLLYHESTFAEEHKSLCIATGHSTATEAAEIAKMSGVEKLLLGHFSIRYSDLQPLLKEAIDIFPETELSEEGKTWHLSDDI
ncbi:MAG: ribonuclease Z [Cyclobacteriaceae bacterium]|nr:ribonuclease Z [Cyclobacteriaceae bacterium]